MVDRSDEAMVQLLTAECTADVNAKDQDSWTALHWAAARGDVTMVRLLIEFREDVNEKRNTGETALQWAAVQRGDAMVQLLTAECRAGSSAKGNDRETCNGQLRQRLGEMVHRGTDINRE